MVRSGNLGFPRIGARRELKKALEAWWSGKIEEEKLDETASAIRRTNWELQAAAGLDFIPSNDFSLYDQVLDMTAVLGAVPKRYGHAGEEVSKDTYFAMARGSQGEDGTSGVPAMEMTKWFNTNYHYIVPELDADTTFSLSSRKPIAEFTEARELGVHTRPVLIGPVTYLLLAKGEGIEPVSLLDRLLPVYEELFRELAAAGADWLQLDEPFLTMDLDDAAVDAYKKAYRRLATDAEAAHVKILLATYFNDLGENAALATALPVHGLHVDLVSGEDRFEWLLEHPPEGKLLSLGVVDGRNIWKSDLEAIVSRLQPVARRLGSEGIVVSPSCSLLHSPVDLELETQLDPEIRDWLAYAKQKIGELSILKRALAEGRESVSAELSDNARSMERKRTSDRVHNEDTRARLAAVEATMSRRASPFEQRRELQKRSLQLSAFPTTTIGSFPQTTDIRKARAAFRKGELDESAYHEFLEQRIAETVRFQEQIGLDVLVHGEPERNDMVEYFGEQLDGFISTKHGWVQSYGSRCVKPPVIFGDVRRPHPMTVRWITYAQSLTQQPMKGMLTGPVTMLQWSFVRDDQPESRTCRQIALALRDEVAELEAAGIRVIQIDEPALREGLPLRTAEWDSYLEWAVDSFKLASSGVADETQIHTHMCYAEFGDIIQAIAALDADVISLESSRSKMELLDIFRQFRYPNQIGPGVYDIHSPRVPTVEEITQLLEKAAAVLYPEQLWVNPDCGLKTRRWEEIEPSLRNMVEAARRVRSTVAVEV
ncbi:MAG: 5-methyltetrahydropteroyltriglutamate--homocysteine S-methyltransferase [Spirochaetes bacterium]|jgi:5-methyltetrahydropteroyltriglutamate--homocysteine methyltransferase|nr:5-methyltetrahydropteroyltriglutamate--homocysteine S-methyltransferase [Spirochaetota bacterium]